MRVNHRLAVLSLFLLVPASIICAQTAHLTGTVSNEQDYRTVNFTSEQGNVKVMLPGILNYPGQGTIVIQGTVIAEPTGKTQKEKDRNSKTLGKMVLTIGSKTISVLPGQNLFDFTVLPNMASPVSIDLTDPGGNRATVELSNRTIPDLPSTTEQPAICTEQKVFITEGNIPVYAANNPSTVFQSTDKFFIKTAGGTTTEVPKLTQSPTQTVLDGKGIPAGSATIVRKSNSRTDETKMRMANLTLTSPNTNLRSGQASTLTVTIDPKITDRDTAEAMQIPIMSLDIKNLTPNVIEMAGGNYQVMTFPTGSNPGSSSQWQVTRTITGVKPGGFNVSATLNPGLVNTNPVHSQLEEIKTAEDFNKWATAIKKDLQAYLKDLPKDDFTRRDLVQRAIDYMPTVNSDADLDLAKIEARYLVRYLPSFRDNVAGQGFSAYQAYRANDRLKNAGPATNWPIHVDIIEKGLAFIQNQNTNPIDPSVSDQVNQAMKATEALKHDYSTKNAEELATALQNLNSTPFVTGLTGANATVLYSFGLMPDGTVDATKDGEQIIADKGRSVEFFDDNTIVIYKKGVPQVFHGVPAAGTTVKQMVQEFYDRGYQVPKGLGCDSLTKLCNKTQALTLFWGDVYSVTNGKAERRLVKGVTKETSSQSSLLISRGWELDCCTGAFRLRLFFQSMNDKESISLTDQLNHGYDCPLPADCPECKRKCEEMKKLKEQNK